MTNPCNASTSCISCTAWRNEPSWKYFAAGATGTANYLNPVQGGCFWDCLLIAAMSSLAWVNPKFFPYKDPSTNAFTFVFYPDGIPTEVQVNKDLIVGNADPNLYCGAKSNKFVDPTWEIWPSIIEKAFAKLCIQRKWPNNMPSSKLTDVNYFPPLYDSTFPQDPYWGNPFCLVPSDWGGNAVIVMDWLAGCINRTVLTLYEKLANGCPDRTKPINLPGELWSGTNVYTYILRNFCQAAGGTNKTKHPLAAWTYQDDACLPPNYAFSPSGIQKNHSYSILGILSPNYIILRDPCGVDPSTIPPGGFAAGPYVFWNASFPICKMDGPSLGFTTGAKNSLVLSRADGVFGITESDFKAYFEAFGWVQ